MTTNQKYRGLNNRFESRATRLRAAGFVYREACPGVAVFSRTRYGRERNIAAAVVMHADRIAWVDSLLIVMR